MTEVECGHYHWIKLRELDGSDSRTWEPAYRFRAHGGTDVWLVIATNEDVSDDRVFQVGPRLEPPQ